jgi:fructoselysine 6-kinase
VRLVDGDRFFESSDKGVSIFSLDDADLAYLARFDLAHSSYASRLESAVPLIAASTRLSFDFANRRTEAYAAPLLPHVYMAEFSATDLSDPDVEQLAQWALGYGPHYVLVTMGSRGAAVFTRDATYHQPAVPTPNVVDTLGAGDAFIGATLAGMLRNEPLGDVLRAAASLAGKTCQSYGAFGYASRLEAADLKPRITA